MEVADLRPSSAREARSRRAPSTESLFIAALVLFGFRVGLKPIDDNSMFVHLRTGIDMARTGAIPRHDPYSFTAGGTRWIVQSWLPEWTYGWAYRLGGSRLILIEQAVLLSVLVLLIARLARTGSPLRTGLAGGVAVGVGAAYWSPRPLLFGLVAMALTVLVVERRRSPWLLVPIVWVWVSSHGSFPLGLGWLGLRAVGEAIDRRAWPRETARYVGAFLVALAVSALNPLGWRLLTFPLTIGDRRQIFRTIVEWHTPDFQSNQGLFTLAFLAGTLVILVRSRTAWKDLLPVVAFIAGGLLALRNVPVAGVVVAPALGRALRSSRETASAGAAAGAAPAGAPPAAGAGPPPSPVNLAFFGVIAVTALVFLLLAGQQQPVSFRTYPVRAVRYLDRAGLLRSPHRVAEQDIVGCYLILKRHQLHGVRVFVDDRYDMYPLAVSQDYEHLLHGSPDVEQILDRRGVDVVLWGRSQALVAILQAGGRWQDAYHDKTWIVLKRA